MDMALDPESWAREQIGRSQAPLDWSILRARFLAVRDAREALISQEFRGLSKGSFDRETARALSDYVVTRKERLAPVNPNDLDDDKDQGGKNLPVVGKKRPVTEE